MAEDNNALSVSVAPEAVTTRVSVDGNGAIGKSLTTGDSLKVNTADEVLEADLKATDAEDGDEGNEPEGGLPSKDSEGELSTKDALEDGQEIKEVGDLPEFDAANEEVRSAYEAKYITEVDGKPRLNLDAFNEETQAHLEAGKLDINKGSREFIKDLMGIDDAGIDTYLAGLAQTTAQKFAVLEEVAGGSEAYDAMIGWARADGGYTPAQREAFNAALQKGGEEAETAVALLKSRFERSGGTAPVTKPEAKAKPAIGIRRPGKPARQAAGTPTVNKVEGFNDSEEHRLAMNAAGDDPTKVAAVRARLKASKWFGK